MRKQLRNIIISFCVVVLLVVGVVIGNKVISKTASSSSSDSSSAATITVFKTTSTNITALHVKNSKGEYMIHQQDKKFTLDGVNESILNQSNLSSTVTASANIQASKLIEKNSTNLKKYGLDNPKDVIDITASGKTVTINIGNVTPLADGNYVNVKGSSDVYKVDTTSISTFEGVMTDFVNLTICTVDSSSLAQLTTLEFGGASRTAPIVLDEDTSASASSAASASSGATPTYLMKSPRSYAVNSDNVTTVVTALESLSASGIISLDVSDANLQKYGLKNPQYTFSATYKKDKITLDFGTPFDEDGTTYLPLVLEGTPVIYKIDASTLTFYKYQLTDICSTLLFTENIDTVKSVTVSSGSESYTINMTGTGDKLVGTYGQKKLLTTNLRTFYESVIGFTFEGNAAKPAKGSTYAKIVFTYRDAKKAATTMEFITIDSRKCFWSIDGNGDFYVLKSSIDNMLTTTRNFVAGKTLSQ